MENRDKIKEFKEKGNLDFKKMTMGEFPQELDRRVFSWFVAARARNFCVSGEDLRAKALEAANAIDPTVSFQSSNGWLNRFKRRHKISSCMLSGESKSIERTSSRIGKTRSKRYVRITNIRTSLTVMRRGCTGEG